MKDEADTQLQLIARIRSQLTAAGLDDRGRPLNSMNIPVEASPKSPTPTPEELITTTSQFLLLQKIRTIVPQAFLSRHSLGHYIYVGGFDRFGPAQEQLRQIQPNIPNARVVYFP